MASLFQKNRPIEDLGWRAHTVGTPSQFLAKQDAQTQDQTQRSHIKQELRDRIHEALQTAKELPPGDCLREIKRKLLAIQRYCTTVNKTFIVVEEQITCDQYGLGGGCCDGATLFRGPSDDASVAICVTQKGSLLHRNGCPWTIYRNAGDVADPG